MNQSYRVSVWNKYIGAYHQSDCYLGCGNRITFYDFVCGKVMDKTIENYPDIKNLRPICSCCNDKMQGKNMLEFVRDNKYKSKLLEEDNLNEIRIKENQEKKTIEDIEYIALGKEVNKLQTKKMLNLFKNK